MSDTEHGPKEEVCTYLGVRMTHLVPRGRKLQQSIQVPESFLEACLGGFTPVLSLVLGRLGGLYLHTA